MGTRLSTLGAMRRIGVLCAVWLAIAAAWQQPARARQSGRPTASADAARPPAGQPSSKPALLGDQTDGSRARPVHVIPLRDADGEVIRPADRPLLPFSPLQTCGADCHDVKTVARGWHFDVMGAGAPGARRGEPWILVDASTATQLPLSYHGWPGTFHPQQVGITPFAFALMFGGRTPGGLSGARERAPELQARWAVSGELEPNCLACHDASPAYDQAQYGHQVGLENFRWAVTSASSLGLVTGSAREMPNTFDHLLPFVEDTLIPRIPAVAYTPERFLPNAKVVLDIAREVPVRRCYYCHSTADVGHIGQGRWNRDEDIHLARGMTCVDCHRNGLDHAMRRGYEGELAASASSDAALTCRGCHLASERDRSFVNGRLGAPYPRHAGIPPIHFTKLSCTACHSGPRPEAITRGLKTSQAHRLGGLAVNKAPEALPHLYYPVFAEQPDGVTTPHRLLWPAYWGRLSNGTAVPLAPAVVKKAMAKASVVLRPRADGDWAPIDDGTVGRVLRFLAAERSLRPGPADPPSAAAADTFVYVAGGKLHRLNAAGTLVAEDHGAAAPYTWPMAHDVRPASLALGARGCTDCHAANAAMFFGKVAVDSPLLSDRAVGWAMNRFQKSLDTQYVATFARTFQYRPWLKGGVSAAAAMLLLVVLAYVMSGMQQLSAAAGTWRLLRVLANVVGLAACLASAVTGVPALLSGGRLTGNALMLHVAMVPAFAVGAVLLTLFWAQPNGFGRADWNRLRRPVGRAARHAAVSYFVLVRKIAFWMAAVAAIAAMTTATIAMFPILPSVSQNALFLAHRYSVVPLLVGGALFALSAFAAWIARSWNRGKAARESRRVAGDMQSRQG